jgi:diaminopimelate decarboxylase
MPTGVDVAPSSVVIPWAERVGNAVEHAGTPCYVSAWNPVQDSLARLDAIDAPVRVRSWLSFKTHPLLPLAHAWLRSGRGVEVVSERELTMVRTLDAAVDDVLVNGVAKHSWLPRQSRPRMRVHFDSTRELEALLPLALDDEWRVGVRVQAPDERDAKDPRFRGQFGFSYREAVDAMRVLDAAGADLQSVHFHLGQRRQEPGAYQRAVELVADACDEAGVAPRYVDCGGALPAAGDASLPAALDDVAAAMRRAAERVPTLEEIWIENGRFVSEASAALAIRVVDIKERDDCRYLICDGGRTNHALAADTRPHPILLLPQRGGADRLTTVCGPTCMTDDRLGRWMLPSAIEVGDVIAWLDAGAYHLPWETRFSHGLCAVVWFDEREQPVVARAREAIPAQQAQSTGTRR